MLKKGFTRRRMRRLLGRWKGRRAVFGVDAALLIAFFLVMMGVVAVFYPDIVHLLFDQLIGDEKGAYSLLLEIPVMADQKDTLGQRVGAVSLELYNKPMVTIALSLFAVVLVVAGICYVLESFRIMGEGTATSIIMNSVFTVIMIFAWLPLYNAVAAAVNSFVGWEGVGGSGLIIQSGNEITTLVGSTIVPWTAENAILRFFGSVVFLIITVSILMITVVMGVVRLFILGALACAMPLLLVIRLIPFTKRLAESLIETVIGILFASVIASVFLHFGYMLVAEGGLGGVTQSIIACVTLLGAAYMSTMFAGRLGSLFTSAAGLATMATSTATGLTLGLAGMAVGTGGGALIGGVKGMGKQGVGLLKGAGMGAAYGLGATASSFVQSAATGKLATPRGAVGAMMPAGAALASTPSMVDNYIEKRTGSLAEALFKHNAAGDPLTSVTSELAGEEKEMLLKASPDEFIKMTVGAYPELAERLDKVKVTEDMKKFVAPLPATAVFNMLHRFDAQSRFTPAERKGVMNSAVTNMPFNEEKLRGMAKGYHEPELEKLDPTPQFANDIFNAGPAGTRSRVTMAKITQYARNHYDEKMAAKDVEAAIRPWKGKDGKFDRGRIEGGIVKKVNVSMTPWEKRFTAQRIRDNLEKLERKNPVLTANILRDVGKDKWNKAMKNPKFIEHTMKEVDSYELQAWVKNQIPEQTRTPEKPEKPPEVSLKPLLKSQPSPPPPLKPPEQPRRTRPPPAPPKVPERPKAKPVKEMPIEKQNELYHRAMRKLHEGERKGAEKKGSDRVDFRDFQRQHLSEKEIEEVNNKPFSRGTFKKAAEKTARRKRKKRRKR